MVLPIQKLQAPFDIGKPQTSVPLFLLTERGFGIDAYKLQASSLHLKKQMDIRQIAVIVVVLHRVLHKRYQQERRERDISDRTFTGDDKIEVVPSQLFQIEEIAQEQYLVFQPDRHGVTVVQLIP